eukprot:GEMP01077531.1.p1 GENE.GEMP01077531.1~~GEMP01077531.1.p1  ORF type:complete len:190 (+),score=38.21 GEMP01077531.1:106-675(+)
MPPVTKLRHSTSGPLLQLQRPFQTMARTSSAHWNPNMLPRTCWQANMPGSTDVIAWGLTSEEQKRTVSSSSFSTCASNAREKSSDPRDWALSTGRQVYRRVGVTREEKLNGLRKRPQSALASIESCFEDTKRHIDEFHFRPYFRFDGLNTAVVPPINRSSTPPIRRMTRRIPTRWNRYMQDLSECNQAG